MKGEEREERRDRPRAAVGLRQSDQPRLDVSVGIGASADDRASIGGDAVCGKELPAAEVESTTIAEEICEELRPPIPDAGFCSEPAIGASHCDGAVS